MNLDSYQVSMVLGVVLLLVCNVLMSGRRRLAALGWSLLSGLIGGVVYPLAFSLFMGVAAASIPRNHPWVRFNHAFLIYAQSSLGEGIPRGAALGIFLAVSWNFWRRARAQRLRNASPDVVADV